MLKLSKIDIITTLDDDLLNRNFSKHVNVIFQYCNIFKINNCCEMGSFFKTINLQILILCKNLSGRKIFKFLNCELHATINTSSDTKVFTSSNSDFVRFRTTKRPPPLVEAMLLLLFWGWPPLLCSCGGMLIMLAAASYFWFKLTWLLLH